MDFTTHTLVDGQYVTRTVDLDTVLRRHDKVMEINPGHSETDTAPVLGLLTQTVVHSPLVHWILPATLRDLSKNDVAFIGENFVQVKELRADGHLWDVIRKDYFGARIRNARVVGSMKAFSEEQTSHHGDTGIKVEDDDCSMQSAEQLSPPSKLSPLPPQCILLQLDTGDSVFLVVTKDSSGKVEFISHRHRVSKPMLGLQPGMHLAVDPSSRYMTIGCSEGAFAIYALNSREELKRQYSEGRVPHYVNAERYIYFHGVILKMEFLHPSPDDEGHIILLVLFVLKGKARMKLYEWATDVNLRDIPAHSHRGHLLEDSRRMPLLLIPLTIKSSFILISEKSMAVCQDILTGSPRFIDFNNRIDPPTALFHGSGSPLWTAWARPVRLPEHAARRDDIYVTREDGLVKFLEIDSDEEEFIRADMNIGDFDCNCGAALASLDYHAYDDKTGDLLVTGGDSCAGGTYLVKARHAPVFTASIQNWSPAQDFVIIPAVSTPLKSPTMMDVLRKSRVIPQPDRIFACVGKGVNGAITEFRYGLEANLALELENNAPIMQAWVLHSISCSPGHEDASLFLSSLGDHSVLLELSGDASNCVNLEQGHIALDLNSRTITAATYEGWNIQITENYVVLVNDSGTITRSAKEFLSINDVLSHHETEAFDKLTIAYGAVVHNFVIFTIRAHDWAYLFVLELAPSNIRDTVESSASTANPCHSLGRVASQHTCVTMCVADNILFIVVAEDMDDSLILNFRPVYEGAAETYSERISKNIFFENDLILEEFVSIAVSYETSTIPVLLCGTRNGLLVALEISPSTRQFRRSQCDRVGATPAIICKDEYSDSQERFFLTCDLKLYSLALPKWPDQKLVDTSTKRMYLLHRIWLTDAERPDFQQPSIHGVARLLPSISNSPDGGILIVSGSQLLLAGFSTQQKVVPRHISIRGTPSRLMYSARLGALVVAASVEGESSILFIDPDSGADLSMPLDKKGEKVDYASGFGNANERAFCLLEWSYNKDGNTWQYIVVSTNTGNVLLLSTDLKRRAIPVDNNTTENSHIPPGYPVGRDMIQYYTRHRFKCVEAVYAVAGFADGLFYCSGEILYCEVLDVAEKRFKHVAQYDLPSPAFSLTFEGGKLYVLTSCHSLEIFQIIPSADRGSVQIERTHGDQTSRYALHHITTVTPSKRPLHLVSDKYSSIIGLSPTKGTKADTLDAIFEAQLPYSVVRFRSGKCRPLWDPAWAPHGMAREGCTGKSGNRMMGVLSGSEATESMTGIQQEILGLSIAGSIHHCQVLDHPTWRFLRFLVDRAMHSPRICEFTYATGPVNLEPATEPKSMMHIDGDMLKRVLDTRSLGELVGGGYETDVEATTFRKFRDLLTSMHADGGGLEYADAGAYVNLAYEDLEWLLRPVL